MTPRYCNENGVFHCSCVPTCPHDYVRTSNAVVFQAPSQQQEQLSFGWRMKTTTFLRFLVSSRFVRRMECSALWWWWPKTKIRVPFLPHSPSVYQITMMAHGLWKVLMVSGCLCTRWSAKCIFLIKCERKDFFLQMFVVPYVQHDPKSDMVSFQWWEKKQICEGVVELFCFTTLWILCFQK